MHFQSPIQNWGNVLAVAPHKCFIKAFEGGMLREAKQKWTALGRNITDLHTDFRHYDLIYPFDRVYSFEELKAIWRVNFFRFIDRTYLEQYAAYVDSVEELNEYTDTRMVTDKALLRPYIESCRAAVSVWNSEFRGKTVHSADGGTGLISAHCRLVICNSPVGNDIPPEFFRLAVDSDSILGIHPYSKWVNKVRDSQDFRYHSGRPYYNEDEYGIHEVIYAPTENGPYLDSGNGWRYSGCMDGDLGLLVSGMRSVIRDTTQVQAYKEGRILGPAAMFTSGGFGWAMYQYDTPQLVEVYKMFAQEWQIPEADVDEQLKAQIRQHAQAILDLIPPTVHVWKAGDIALANTNPLITYVAPNGPIKDKRPATPPGGPMVVYDLNVLEVTVDQLWLRVAPGMWVKVADVKLKGT